jgi:hypothetical protein
MTNISFLLEFCQQGAYAGPLKRWSGQSRGLRHRSAWNSQNAFNVRSTSAACTGEPRSFMDRAYTFSISVKRSFDTNA